jgi:two-component system LytT family sensor kinase
MKMTGDLRKLFKIRQFIIFNILLGIVIVTLFMRGALDSIENFLFGLLWAFILSVTQWAGLVLINYLIDLRIKWIEQPVFRSVVGLITLIVYSLFAFVTVQFTMLFIRYNIVPADAWQSISHSIIYPLLISFIISIIFTAIGFFKAWRKALVDAGEMKAEMLAYKYEALRNQLNPHFLFNSFNVLSDLVYSDQKMALKFIHQMSDLFRYVLDSRDKELVLLTEEVEFIRSFIYLLKTRFENKLDIVIDLPVLPDEYIVPMTLQLLVENAVKHNEVSEAYPLIISISRRTDYLQVENTMQKKNADVDSKNTGLKNIIQQFSFFTDKPIEIDSSNGKFRVCVPILKVAEK